METPVVHGIVEQHAEEAAFLWFQRDAAVRRLHYTLATLAELDNRVDAHLDGLLCSGEAGWGICREALEGGEAGELFAASFLAFAGGREDRIRRVLEAGSGDSFLSGGIVSSLGWLSFQQAEGAVRQLLSDGSPHLRRIGIAACASHRRDPGRHLDKALVDPDPLLVARALKAIAQVGRKDLLPYILDYRGSEDKLCRYAAAWSGAMLGDAASVAILRDHACADASRSEEAGEVALCRMPLPEALQWQAELACNEETGRLSVIAAGVIGDPVLVPWLLARMSVPELARIAGESFAMITGVDISCGDLEGACPEGFEAGPTENPEDEDVEADPDYDLPWPNRETIASWWGKHGKAFERGICYLLGEPIAPGTLERVLRVGRHHHRRTAAMRLAMTEPGRPLFEVRAPGFRQKKLLSVT